MAARTDTRSSQARGLWQHVERMFGCAVALPLLVGGAPLFAQEPEPSGSQEPEALRAQEEAWALHGQFTSVVQGHGAFPSPYESDNSFQSRREVRPSFTATVYLGARLWEGGELHVDPELISGQGLSQGLGLGGPPNGETLRSDRGGVQLLLSQAFLRQTWNLPGEEEVVEAQADQLAGLRSRRRVVLTAGRFYAGGIFDANAYAHDSGTDFLNWALMDTAAWDAPVNTRGAVAELYWDAWAFRLGAYLMPKEADGDSFEQDLGESRGVAFEAEREHSLGGREGAVRLLLFENRAPMGDYREALAASPAAPDITATRTPGRVKRGAGLSVEQEVSEDLGVFLRAGWNDGNHESWAFTEVDRSWAAGVSWGGGAWNRPADRLGAAVAVNGLSGAHRDYLAAGGYGFALGDGALRYGPERLAEAYYACGLREGLSLSLDIQRIWNPGFNRDRGPVSIFAFRVHYGF